MRKTIYWDIKTEVKLKRVAKKLKTSQSTVVRKLVQLKSFDEMIKELNEDQKHWKDISLKNL